MNDKKHTMFNDRRISSYRRKHNTRPLTELDRRLTSRRIQQFEAQPWWLKTTYAEEHIDESAVSPNK